MQAKSNRDSSAKLLMVFLPRALAVVILIAVAAGIVTLLIKTRAESEKRPPEVASVVVHAIDSDHHPTDRIWTGYGTVQSMRSAEIVAEVAGRVVERPRDIEAGQRVKKGELIVRLEDTDYVNQLDASQQALNSIEAQIDGLDVEEEQTRLQVQYASEEIEAAKRDLGRIDEAIAAGAGNAGERDSVYAALLRTQRQLATLQQQLDLIPSRRLNLKAQLASQRASARMAQLNVERSSIRAPFDAELQSVMPREGDWVALGMSVARVVDLSRLEIPLKLPASASAWVRVGDEAQFWVREPVASPDWVGEIVRVSPEADTSSRTITVFAEVRQDPANPDRLLPGQFVHGRVLTHDEHDRVILPRRAVQSGTVFVAGPMQDQYRVIEKVPVRVAYSFEGQRPEIDPNENQWVALELGYEPVEGSHVVVSLLDQIVTGMRVRLDRDPKLEPDPVQARPLNKEPAPGEDEGGTP
ncbi:MAG: HlyD family efflux transporter periplasmic adaptor subunit [Phycisphaerales bacterium]|nr:HlyD family efflux transporter periplasmic adaptor subunit [Phycisphaerales bacterium]